MYTTPPPSAHDPEQIDIIHDLTDHAVTLLDCADDLVSAIEENYRATDRFRRRYDAGEPADPRELLVAFGGLRALLRQAFAKMEAQDESLERLRFAIVPRPPADSRSPFRVFDAEE